MNKEKHEKEEIIWEKNLKNYASAPTSVRTELKIRLFKIIGIIILALIIALVSWLDG